VPSEECFTPLDWERPAKTTDLGANGYTASLSDWHQLLQITAPYSGCGLVHTRGNFPDTPDAILSRAQYEGSGSWGFRVSPESQIRTGAVTAQGLINFRWPFMSVELATDQQSLVGQLFMCSFVKGGTFYQIFEYSSLNQRRMMQIHRTFLILTRFERFGPWAIPLLLMVMSI
jgi:hypothetical protein